MRNLAAIMFALALILGTITVLLARNVVNNQRAAPTTVSEEPEEEMSTLVVAAVKFQFGDEITAEKLKVVPWPNDPNVRPPGSFVTISDVIGDQRRVAIRSMNINDPITQEKLSGFGYRATLSQIVPVDMRAIAIRISAQTGVAGFILPGDRVDVLHAFARPGSATIESTLILRDVRVLAIDQTADETTQGAIVANTATLEVSQEQAQKLSLAAKVGSLDLVLRPMRVDEQVLDERSKPIKVTDLTTDNTLGVEPEKETVKPVKRTYRPIRSTRSEPKPDPTTRMKVTRGTQTSTTVVQKDGVVTEGGVSDLGSQMSNQVGEMSDLTSNVMSGGRNP